MATLLYIWTPPQVVLERNMPHHEEEYYSPQILHEYSVVHKFLLDLDMIN
jgi:hypothetical protein